MQLSKKILQHLFVVLFLLFLFDGALRKWIYQDYAQVILLIKDIFAVLIIIIAFSYGHIKKNYWTLCILLFTLLLIVAALLQLLIYHLPLFPIVFGIRNYVLLLFIPFIFLSIYDEKFFLKIIRILFWVSIPTAILVFIQTNSPVDAFINRSVGNEDQQMIFTVGSGVVRPYGFFSFTSGQVYYSLIIWVLNIINFTLPRRKKFFKNALLQIIFLFASLTCVFTSGSRAAYILFAFSVIIYFGTGLLNLKNIKQQKSALQLLIFFLLLSPVIFIIFSTNFELIVDRFDRAAAGGEGGVLNRINNSVNIFIYELPNIPYLGYGLGVFTAKFQKNLALQNFYYENEWLRILYESGVILGSIFILYRISLGIKLLIDAIKKYMLIGNIIPLISISILLYTLIMGNVTFNTNTMYFNWLYTSIVFGILKYS